MFLYLCFLLPSLIYSQTSCLDDGNQGPLINGGNCPSGLTLTDDGVCCLLNFVVNAGGGATTLSPTTSNGQTINTIFTTQGGTTNAACVDRINPSTGVSDCPRLSFLCQNSLYFTLMTQQCAQTCGRCSSVSTFGATTCVDRKNPRTGVSDCQSLTNLCNTQVYREVMRVQCPKTCGFCSSIVQPIGASSNCMDLKNNITGISDCQTKRDLCTDPNYLNVMRRQCPRTCGFC